jgi:RNA polymerase sigma-32 factor
MEDIGNPDDESNPPALDLDAGDLDDPTPDDADDADDLTEPAEPAYPSEPTDAPLDGPTLDLDALQRAEIRRPPMLEVEEERRLAQAWREHADRAARDRLVDSHARLVAKIARGYAQRIYDRRLRRQQNSEFIAVGNAALMNAAEKFDPSRGFRFSTYAMKVIANAIGGYIKHSRSIANISDYFNQKLLALNLEKAKIGRLDNNALTRDEVKLIAKRLGWTEKMVIKVNAQLGGTDQSLNAPIRDDDGVFNDEKQDQLTYDDDVDQETRLGQAEELSDYLEAAHALLDKRALRILMARRLTEEPILLEALAAEFGVTAERVRQIEADAFEEVQKALNNGSFKPARAARHFENFQYTEQRIAVTLRKVGKFYDFARSGWGPRGWADEEFARGLVDGYTSQRTFDANDAFEFVKRGKRWPDWEAEPMHERLTRCEQLQQRDRSRGALSRMKAAGRGWFYKSIHPANLSKRDRQLAKLGKPPSPTKAQANGKTRPPATAHANGKGGGWAVFPEMFKTKSRRRPLASRLAPDMDDRTGAADDPCGLATVGFRLPQPLAKPAPSISEDAWHDKQRAWSKEEKPRTEWPKIAPRKRRSVDPIAEEQARAGVHSNLPMCRKSAKEYRARQARQRRTVTKTLSTRGDHVARKLSIAGIIISPMNVGTPERP